MKRIIILTLTLIVTVICHAASPSLACEKIFDRKDLRTEGHNLVKINQPNNYFRSITAENDKKLQNDIKKVFEQDRKKAYNVVEGYDGNSDREYSILNISSNGYVINIGFYWNKNGYVNLFIQSDPDAFKK